MGLILCGKWRKEWENFIGVDFGYNKMNKFGGGKLNSSGVSGRLFRGRVDVGRGGVVI